MNSTTPVDPAAAPASPVAAPDVVHRLVDQFAETASAYRTGSYNESLPTTDSRLIDDDIVIRCNGDTIIGCAILHASKRLVPAAR